MKLAIVLLVGALTVATLTCLAVAQRPRDDGNRPDKPPGKSAPRQRGEGRAATRAPARSGVVAAFAKNPDGEVDGIRLDDGTEVKFPPRSAEKLAGVVALKDRVTVEGWTHPGEAEVHAATIKNEATGKLAVVDRFPPGADEGERPRPPGDENEDKPPRPEAQKPRPPREGEEERPQPGPRKPRPPREEPRGRYSLEQAVSDRAQLHTIAFDGLAFLTGDFAGDTFLPPGKVSDYFGFQYLRDIDAAEGGHNTSFLTRIALNMLALLSDDQKAQLVALGQEQQKDIRRFAEMRFPLMRAFRRNLEGDLPAGRRGLDREAVMKHSAELYALDGLLSFQRARVMGRIFRSLTAEQKAALARLKFGDSRTWPDVPEPRDRRRLPHELNVAVMTYASEMFAWYAGSLEADVYFCPERHGMYFGGFGMKTAPAMGKRDYAISTTLTGDSGEAFLAALTTPQRKQVTDLVDLQRKNLGEIVTTRRAIATELRRFLKDDSADQDKVLALSRRYGELDGELSYLYATAFAKVGQTLTASQKEKLAALRVTNPADPKGPFLYSRQISMPQVGNTDFLFGVR